MHNQDSGMPGTPDAIAPPAGPGRRSPRWWLAVQSALMAYGLTLGAALVLMALLVLGFFLGGTGALNGMNDSAGSMGASLDGPSALLIYPFFLAAMALGGTPVLTVSSETFTDLAVPLVSVWVGVLPLLLTAVSAASLWWLGRRAERKSALDSDGLRWLYSGLTGLVLAAFSVLLSLIVSLRGNSETDSAYLTAASPGLVVGAVLLGTAASWAGRKREAAGTLPWFTLADRFLPGVRAAVRVAGVHYLVYSAMSGAVIFVTALVHGGAAVAFAAPLWLPTASAWAYGVGHLSLIVNHGLSLPAQWPPSVGELPVWAGAAAGVLGPLLAAAASVAWFLAREHHPELLARRTSWLTLPAVFALAGAVVSVASVVVSGQISPDGGFTPGFEFAGPAWWTFLVMAVWGAVIELGSRTFARQVAHLVPAPAAAFFARRATDSPAAGER